MASVEQLLVRIDATTEQLRREMGRAEKTVTDTVSKMERDLKRNGIAFTTLQQNVERATRAIDQNGATTARRAADIASYGQEMDRLRAKYSPLFAAQQQYRRQLDEVNRALSVGAINQAEYATALAATKTSFAQQVTAIRGTSNALNAGGGSYRSFGLFAQQAGFQVGDFAVQVASGQSAVVAFTQQFSQLAGFFGPVGAVLGAVGAIAGGLYLAFGRTAEGTDEATKAMDAYKRSLEESIDVSNDAVAAADRLASARKNEAVAAAEAALKVEEATISQLRADILAYQRDLDALQQGPNPNENAIRQAQGQIDKLTQAFDEASDRAATLFGNIGVLRDSVGRPVPEALTTSMDKAAKSARTLSDVLADLNMEADQLAAKQTAAAVESITRVLEQAKTPAERYADQMLQIDLALEQVNSRVEQLRAMGEGGRADALEAAIGNPDEVRAALAKLNPALRETQKETEKISQQSEVLAEPFKNAIESIQRTFADTFEDIFSGGVRSFGDLADSIKRIMVRMAAEIATLQFFGPQGFAGLIGSAGGMGSIAGSASGGGGIMGLLSNGLSIGKLFAGGGLANLGSNFAAGGIGGALFGLAPAATALGGGATAAGLGVSAVAGGATNAGIVGAGSAGLLGSGGAIGALGIGGLAIGAVLLASQLFKKKPSDFTASFQGMLDGDLQTSEDKANDQTRQMRDQIQTATESALQAVLGGLGLDTPSGTYLDVAAGSRDGLRFWLYDTMDDYFGQPANVRSDPIASGQFDSVEDLIAGVLKAVIERAGTEGLDTALRAVAEQADFSDLETALADIELAKFYDGLGKTIEATAEADAAIAEINARFDELTEFAERFGLAVDKVDTGRADAFADLAEGFTSGLRDQILALTDPAQLAVRELEAWRDAQIRNANAIAQANGLAGASTEDLALIAELFGLRMQEVAGGVGDALDYITSAQASMFNEQLRAVQTYLGEVERSNAAWKRLSDQLRQTRQGLLIDDALSPLSPELRRQEAARQFEDAARRAGLGDQEAIAELPDISRAYLEASRAYYASSEAYFADFERVQQVLADTEALTGRHLSIGDQQLAAARDQVEKLTALINGDQLIVSSIEQANTILSGILSQLQAAGVPGAGGSGSGTGSLGTGISYVDTGYQRSTDDVIHGLTRTQLDQVRASVGITTAGGGLVQARIASDPAFAEQYREAIRAAGGTPGFATGGSFRIGGPAGNDNLIMPPVRVTAGEMVNISRRDSMDGMLAELRALRAEVADLRAVTAAGANAQVGATDRAAKTFDNGFRDSRQRVRIGASAPSSKAAVA
jgi:ribosomal protein L29